MKGDAPYIMPDGRSLSSYLVPEERKAKSGRNKHSGKNEMFLQLSAQKAWTGSSDEDLQELKALQAVGARRRRRWLNDKILRDLAGPMTATDMESMFKPVPWGDVHQSVFTSVQKSEAASVWDQFCCISSDKERLVLEKWEQHNREQSRPRWVVVDTPASEAVRRWKAVNKKAKHALRRLNPHKIWQMEVEILEYVSQVDPVGPLILPAHDPFERLLLHGLAQYYGLSSSSRPACGGTELVLSRAKGEIGEGVPTITVTDMLLACAAYGRTSLAEDELTEYVTQHVLGVIAEN